MPVGTYAYTVVSDNYQTIEGSVEITGSIVTTSVTRDLLLKLYTLEIYVTPQSAGTSVTVSTNSPISVNETIQTNQSGLATFALRKGTYSVVLSRTGYVTKTLSVTMTRFRQSFETLTILTYSASLTTNVKGCFLKLNGVENSFPSNNKTRLILLKHFTNTWELSLPGWVTRSGSWEIDGTGQPYNIIENLVAETIYWEVSGPAGSVVAWSKNGVTQQGFTAGVDPEVVQISGLVAGDVIWFQVTINGEPDASGLFTVPADQLIIQTVFTT